MQSAAMAAAGAEAAAERKERRTDGRGRIPDERRNGRGEGEEELHASLVPPPPISERTDSSRGLTAARWFPPSRRSFLSLSSPRPRPAASPCPRPSAVCGGWLVPTHVYCPAHSLNDGLSPMAAAAARRRKEGKRENSTLIRQKCAALPAVNGCIGIDTSIMPSLQLGVVILEATETARKKQGDLGSQNASLYFIDWHKTVIFMRHPHEGFSSRARARRSSLLYSCFVFKCCWDVGG